MLAVVFQQYSAEMLMRVAIQFVCSRQLPGKHAAFVGYILHYRLYRLWFYTFPLGFCCIRIPAAVLMFVRFNSYRIFKYQISLQLTVCIERIT